MNINEKEIWIFQPHSNKDYERVRKGRNMLDDQSLRWLMRRLRAEYPERRLEIFEISVDPDSALWRSRIATDSAHWKQGWLMGGTANPSIRNLAISRLPLFIAVDSAGRQLYRGPVAEQAVEQVTDRLTRPSADTR